MAILTVCSSGGGCCGSQGVAGLYEFVSGWIDGNAVDGSAVGQPRSVAELVDYLSAWFAGK